MGAREDRAERRLLLGAAVDESDDMLAGDDLLRNARGKNNTCGWLEAKGLQIYYIT